MTGKGYYKASIGGGTAFMRVFHYLVFIVCIIIFLSTFPLLAVFFILLLLFSLSGIFFVPKGYWITDEDIIIERFGSDIKINMNEIADIHYSPATRTPYGGVLYGGGFGYAGTLYRSGYGGIKIYSKRLSRMVMITTILDRHFLIAPVHPEQFVEKVEEILYEYYPIVDPMEVEPVEVEGEEDSGEKIRFRVKERLYDKPYG